MNGEKKREFDFSLDKNYNNHHPKHSSHNASLLIEQTCRLYATKHLRVLLRASVEFFSSWGMELLVTQLHDHSKAVSMEALDILDEACEDKVTDGYDICFNTVKSAFILQLLGQLKLG